MRQGRPFKPLLPLWMASDDVEAERSHYRQIPGPTDAAGVPARPRRSARASKCLTEEGCQRVPPRGVRSCMLSSWAAICWSVRSGAAALIPATSLTSLTVSQNSCTIR